MIAFKWGFVASDFTEYMQTQSKKQTRLVECYQEMRVVWLTYVESGYEVGFGLAPGTAIYMNPILLNWDINLHSGERNTEQSAYATSIQSLKTVRQNSGSQGMYNHR